MSFIDDMMTFAAPAIDLFTGSSTASMLARTAAIGLGVYGVSQLTKSNTGSSATATTAPDPGVRLQVTPDVNHRVPVVYGAAYLGGIITDVQMADGNKTLYVVVTISEKTGIKLSDSTDSVIDFQDIYYNDNRLVFQSDGITVDYVVDRNGNFDTSLRGLIEVRCYNNGSSSGVLPVEYSGIAPDPAGAIMPGWDANYKMTGLVFALVKVTYNKDRGLTSLPTMRFHVKNSMTQPGDVIYDYMTNTRYGAGIDSTEIYSA